MKCLTLIASLVGSITILGLFVAVTSRPEGYYDEVEAKFSPRLDKLFWINQKTEELSIYDLERKKRSSSSMFDLRQPRWAHDGDSILTLSSDAALRRYQFATIDLKSMEISKGGEPASFFVQALDSNLLFFGRGDYMADTGHFDIYGIASHRLAGTSSIDGGYSMAKFSPSGELLAVSMWGYNDPDRFEVFRLKDWSKVIDAEHEASFAFFLPDGGHLVAVESSAAWIALHRYDLETGKLLKTTRESPGWCEAAALSPDGKTLAIGTLDYSRNPQIELYSTDDLTLLLTQTVDGGRAVLDLAFEPAGDSLLAITRSAEVRRWRISDRELVKVARIIPKRIDLRWILVWVGFGLYAAIWVVLLAKRRGLSDGESRPQIFVSGKFWVRGVIGFELFYLFFNFSVATSYLGVILIGAHVVLAGAAVLFIFSSAILRFRTNYSVGIAFTAILGVGALFGLTIVHAAIASV